MIPRTRSRPEERGSIPAEVALLTPLLLALLLLIVAAGRLVAARAEVDGAARDSARAASISRTPAAAQTAAQASATATLSQATTCQSLTVTTNTSAFAPGGVVTVEVACTVSLAGLTFLPLPGQQTLSADFTHPIDVFRGISREFTEARVPDDTDTHFEAGEIGG